MRVAGKIFVNYRRDDAKAEAARLHDRLAQSFGAANVFMDVDNLLPGERFDLRLKEALAGTDVFLAVIGARWMDLLEARAGSGERDYVREEIAAALAAKLVVIPVLMDRAPLPKAASLPEDIRELALFHKHDVVYESFGRDVQALIAAIEAHRQARDKQAGLAREKALAESEAAHRARRKAKEEAEAARLARENESERIEAARRLRQRANEEAEAQRRAQMEKEARAKHPEPAALPWKPAAAIVAFAAVVILLIAQPWLRGPAPPVSQPPVIDPQHVELAMPQAGRIAVDAAVVDNAHGRWFLPGAGKTESFKDCPNCPEMVVVPAGSFTMGSPESEPGHLSAEGPQHKVTISKPFAAGKFGVTFAEWDAGSADSGGGFYIPSDQGWGKGDRPVINVHWIDAQAYVQWLSRKTGKTYRLLTEAEREYVTRAGTTTPFWWGASISTSQANYDGNYAYAGGSNGEYRRETLPVKSFQPNPWGLYQVHGNVWEWVEDCWEDSYHGAPDDGSARTSRNCGVRVVRGASWNFGPQYLRAAYRFGGDASIRGNTLGFRVARTLE